MEAEPVEQGAIKLRIVWWNTHLYGVTDADHPQVAFVATVLAELVSATACALIGLCEVAPAIAEHIAGKARLDLADWDVLRDPAADIALLVKRAEAIVPTETFYTGKHLVSGKTYVAGLSFDVRPVRGGVFQPLLCHWPAIGMGDQDHVRRVHVELAGSVARVVRERVDEIGVLVLGDFNDEPHAAPMCDAFSATRDVLVARRAETGLLYNAAWRWLVRLRPFDGRDATELPAGTHYYRSGVESRWRTYDQLLVSSVLLQGYGWTLREDERRVWYGDVLKGGRGAFLASSTRSGSVDHLPILTTLEYIL